MQGRLVKLPGKGKKTNQHENTSSEKLFRKCSSQAKKGNMESTIGDLQSTIRKRSSKIEERELTSSEPRFTKASDVFSSRKFGHNPVPYGNNTSAAVKKIPAFHLCPKIIRRPNILVRTCYGCKEAIKLEETCEPPTDLLFSLNISTFWTTNRATGESKSKFGPVYFHLNWPCLVRFDSRIERKNIVSSKAERSKWTASHYKYLESIGLLEFIQ